MAYREMSPRHRSKDQKVAVAGLEAIQDCFAQRRRETTSPSSGAMPRCKLWDKPDPSAVLKTPTTPKTIPVPRTVMTGIPFVHELTKDIKCWRGFSPHEAILR